jgi:hypothetical protein
MPSEINEKIAKVYVRHKNIEQPYLTLSMKVNLSPAYPTITGSNLNSEVLNGRIYTLCGR